MAVTAAPDIDALMRELADGNRSTFSPLFGALWAPVLEVCRRMLPVQADADDAAQSAMLRIFERASAYDRSRPAVPWALGIAAWECRTLRKSRQRRNETPVMPLRSDDGAAAESVEQQELMDAAVHVLGQLSEADQQTLLDTYWERAEVSGPTQRKRRQRALERLRQGFRRIYGLD